MFNQLLKTLYVLFNFLFVSIIFNHVYEVSVSSKIQFDKHLIKIFHLYFDYMFLLFYIKLKISKFSKNHMCFSENCFGY